MKRHLMFSIIIMIFTGSTFVDRIFAQVQMNEMSLQNEEGSSPKRTLRSTKGRNPFILPPGVYPLSKGERNPVQNPFHEEEKKKSDTSSQEIEPISYKVKAILISENICLASIGRNILTVGDRINGEEILEIKPDRVILRKGDKKRALLLNQSPIRLTTEGP